MDDFDQIAPKLLARLADAGWIERSYVDKNSTEIVWTAVGLTKLAYVNKVVEGLRQSPVNFLSESEWFWLIYLAHEHASKDSDEPQPMS